MRWAAWDAELNTPTGKDGQGGSARAHLEIAAKRGHVGAIERLTGPEFPEALFYLWEWSDELAACRRYGMNGPEPTTYSDIDAWARLTDRRPFPHEVQALLAVDRVRCFPASLTERE